MNTVRPKSERAQDVIDHFCRDDNPKFKHRYAAMYEDMETYIKKSGYQGKVYVNRMILGYALVDYFEDIDRLKDFHKISHINSIKLVSYMSYWLLRRKPLQITEEDKRFLYVNERFVLAYIMEFLSYKDEPSILERQEKSLDTFIETLFYFFKYRQFDAKDLEIMLTAFFAGQIYQSKDIDLSEMLPSSDYANDIANDAPYIE